MDINTVKERLFFNNTNGVRDENSWKLIVTIGERITFMDGTTKEEKVEAMSIDTDYASAQRIALTSALRQIDELVYTKGFDSLIEAREYERSLVKPNGSNTNNPITVS